MEVRLVLDTNAYSRLMRGDAGVAGMVRAAAHIYLPAPVLGELMFGFQGGNRFQENKQQLMDFLAAPSVEFVATDQTVCDRYSMVLQQLKSKGRPIPTNDVWIAAHALALGADLLSADEHFGAIEGLSWLR